MGQFIPKIMWWGLMLLEVIPKGITLLVIYMNTHECVAGSSTCEKQREHPRRNFGTDLDPFEPRAGRLWLAVLGRLALLGGGVVRELAAKLH